MREQFVICPTHVKLDLWLQVKSCVNHKTWCCRIMHASVCTFSTDDDSWMRTKWFVIPPNWTVRAEYTVRAIGLMVALQRFPIFKRGQISPYLFLPSTHLESYLSRPFSERNCSHFLMHSMTNSDTSQSCLSLPLKNVILKIVPPESPIK